MSTVRLKIPGVCNLETSSWHDVSGVQASLEEDEKTVPESFADCEIDEVLALEDRNSFEDEWPGRRVFVVKGEEFAYIFDEHGAPIHEPEHT